MSTSFSLNSSLRRSFALAVLAGTSFVVAGAQTTPAQESAGPAQPVSFSTSPVIPQLGVASDALFSSSSSSADESATAAANTNLASIEKNFAFPGANAQYGRRRYGAPRYRGGNTNADGSEKWGAYAGAGFTSPVGTNSNYLTVSYGIQGGVERNLNKHLGVGLEFDYDRFGMTGQTIQNQSIVYFNDPTNANGLDANSHIWNFSIQPVYQIYSGQGLGAYITGGVGFYHKVANFTLPQEEQYCDYFYGCYGVYVNANVDHYTSNAPGFDAGFGLTYKFSRFSNERFYGEVRYVFVDNSARAGYNVSNINNYNGGYNFFPQNSNTTSYFPVKFGIRF